MGTPGFKMAVSNDPERNPQRAASDPRSVSEPQIALVSNSRAVDPCGIGHGSRLAAVWKPYL